MLAFALDVDLIVAVDEDVGDRRVAQERLERPETEQLVDDVGDQRFALEQAERRRLRLLLEHADDQAADFGLRVLAPHARQPLEVQPVQQVLVNLGLDFLVFGVTRVHGSCRAFAGDHCRRSVRRHLLFVPASAAAGQPAEQAAAAFRLLWFGIDLRQLLRQAR